MMALSGGKRVGRREGGGERENVFCKGLFDDEKELGVIFFAGLGAWGERRL